MNLAIEYVIRTGIAKSQLAFPFSLYLRNIINPYIRRIVVVAKHKDKNLMVKHWNVYNCKSDDVVPPIVEYQIIDTELYSSPTVVVPEYEMIEFKPARYRAKRQYSDSERGRIQDNEYKELIDTFCNPDSHQQFRLRWLWETFIITYVPDMYCFLEERPLTLQQIIVFHQRTELELFWKFWQRYMRLENAMASELAFHEEYHMNCKKSLLRIESQPTGYEYLEFMHYNY